MQNIIFYIEDYKNYVKYANDNGLTIIEIPADEKGRRFTLKEPILSEKDKNLNELTELKIWYDNYYAQHEQKYRRLHTLNKLTDDEKDPYSELINLYNEAEIKRARIHELEALLNE